MEPTFEGHWVLLTGATTGIGRDLVELFAMDRANLILNSRSADRLLDIKNEIEDRYHITVRTIPEDLAKSGGAARLVEQVRSQGLDVDILVHNAGYGVFGYFHEEPLEAQMGMIELHVAATTYLAHAFLPRMIQKKRGGVLNVGSTGAFQPVPIENVYCATKTYVLHFTEALAEELREKSPVRITCFCPGPTETRFFSTPLMKAFLPPRMSRMPSKKVAEIGFRAFKKRETICIAGLRNRLLVFGTRLFPRFMVSRVAKAVVEKGYLNSKNEQLRAEINKS